MNSNDTLFEACHNYPHRSLNFNHKSETFDARCVEYIEFLGNNYYIRYWEVEQDPLDRTVYKKSNLKLFGPCSIDIKNENFGRLFEPHETQHHVLVPKKEKEMEEKIYNVFGKGGEMSRLMAIPPYNKCSLDMIEKNLEGIMENYNDVEIREYTFSKRMKPKVTTTIELEEV